MKYVYARGKATLKTPERMQIRIKIPIDYASRTFETMTVIFSRLIFNPNDSNNRHFHVPRNREMKSPIRQ